MDIERFQRTAELFEQPRDLPLQAQRRQLEQEPDAQVRLGVERLLEQHRVAERGADESLLRAGAALRRGLGVGAPERVQDLPLPATIGRFAITGEIARGGIGVVLRATDDSIGRDVAVKILQPQYANDAAMIGRLRLEGRVGGRLQHPGIVPVYEIGDDAVAGPFLVMKVVEGRTLAALMAARDGCEDQRQRLLHVFEQVCQAMAYAHSRRVLHRDLKPHNLMVGTFGEVQVMDWGLAKLLEPAVDEAGDVGGVAKDGLAIAADPGNGSAAGSDGDGLSMAGTALGTPAYMAPEQARGDRDAIDPRLDVFGLGAILCEILTGAPPFAGAGTGTVLEQARAGDLQPALRRLADCGADAGLLDLARRCLAVDPAQRPADAGELARRLRGYLDSLEQRARALQLQATAAEARAAAERRARRRTVTLGACVVVAVLLGAGLWLSNQLADQRRQREAGDRLASALLDAQRVVADAEAAEPQDTTRWAAAASAARNAARLVTVDADHQLSARAAQLVTDAEQRLIDLRFARRLEALALDARLLSQASGRGEASAYRDLFAERLGADFERSDADRLAHQLQGFAYPQILLRSLDAWALAERQVDPGSSTRRRVLRLAELLDSDPWRRELRRASYQDDRERLLALAASFRAADEAPYSGVTLALHLLFTGAERQALTVLEKVYRLHPDDFEVAFHLAMLHGAQHNSTDYLRYATASLGLQPRSALATIQLADAFLQSDRYDEAIHYARRSVALSAGGGAKYLILIRTLFSAGLTSEAVELVDEVEAGVDESHAVFPVLAGYCAAMRLFQGRVAAAVDWLRRGAGSPQADVQDPPLFLTVGD